MSQVKSELSGMSVSEVNQESIVTDVVAVVPQVEKIWEQIAAIEPTVAPEVMQIFTEVKDIFSTVFKLTHK